MDGFGSQYLWGRAPHGARGLKREIKLQNLEVRGRAPHGARGLKPIIARLREFEQGVAPRTGRVD